jgi:hypothetical protein
MVLYYGNMDQVVMIIYTNVDLLPKYIVAMENTKWDYTLLSHVVIKMVCYYQIAFLLLGLNWKFEEILLQ